MRQNAEWKSFRETGGSGGGRWEGFLMKELLSGALRSHCGSRFLPSALCRAVFILTIASAPARSSFETGRPTLRAQNSRVSRGSF